MSLLSRRVSARRTLAVLAAVLALPWSVLVFAYSLGDDDSPALAPIAAVTAALIVAGPVVARWRHFGRFAGGLWLVLVFIGVVGGLAGGFLIWPGACLFLVAAFPARGTEWRLGRVLAVLGGVVAACATIPISPCGRGRARP